MNDPLLVRETRWYSRPGFKAVKTLNGKWGKGKAQTKQSKDLVMIN